jgi:16S rRNA processing protein RimM
VDEGWIAIAILGRTRGNRGEITAIPLSTKLERYQTLGDVYLLGRDSTEPEKRAVESTWFHDATLIFKFKGVDTISDAELLSGCEVRVPLAERTKLDEGEYFESDLKGCAVIDRRTGETLGHITALDEGGGQGLLVVDGKLMIPFVRAICIEIDPAAKRIAVELPEGLKDLNPS